MREELIDLKQKAESKFSHAYDNVCCAIFLPFFPRWVRPNHLTLVRLIGIPFLVYLLWNGHFITSLILFVCLALTDMIDGTMARCRNQITDLGVLLDPIADKLLIASTIFVLLLKLDLTLAILIIGLDFLVILLGIVIKVSGKDLSFTANLWGKIKLNLQVIGLSMVFLGLIFAVPELMTVARGVLWGSIFFSVISLINGGA